jgi:putative chitinase
MLSPEKLHALGIGAEWSEPLTTTFIKFGMVSPKEQASFIGQASHESGHFRLLEENLNYRAETLMKLWPKRFPTMEEANKYARNPQLIANHIYCNRMGNRDESSGDGFRFRGRGLFQLTGHDNYYHAGQALGQDFVMKPELVATPMFASLTAGWFWQTHGCAKLVDNPEQMCKRINGGLIGLQDRIAQSAKALQILGG